MCHLYPEVTSGVLAALCTFLSFLDKKVADKFDLLRQFCVID